MQSTPAAVRSSDASSCSKSTSCSRVLSHASCSSSYSNRFGPDCGDDHQICRLGVCLLMTQVPAEPKLMFSTPCCGWVSEWARWVPKHWADSSLAGSCWSTGCFRCELTYRVDAVKVIGSIFQHAQSIFNTLQQSISVSMKVHFRQGSGSLRAEEASRGGHSGHVGAHPARH